MFSFLGKTLVLIYGALAFFCLMAAVAVYTQQMNFATPKGGDAGKKTFNRVEEVQNRTKELLAANNRALTRMNQELEPLVETEIDVLTRRDYYQDQMTLMQTGKYKGKDVATPIQVLEYDNDTGLMKMDKAITRNPIEVKKGVPARTTEFYLAGLKQAAINFDAPIVTGRKDTNGVDEKMTTRQLIDAHALSTKIINGSEEPGMFLKGLRTRIKEQDKIAVDADAEYNWLDDFITRRTAEKELFVKRRDSLIDRLAELRKFYRLPNPAGDPGN